jgi:phospholipase/carboxylesterase
MPPLILMAEFRFIPAAAKNSGRLMIVLHGLGDSIEGYRWLPPALDLAGLNYLLVNAPDAYCGGYSWYDFSRDPAPGIERSRALLFELLDQQQLRGFSARETFLFGFSQGCLMTIDVGLRYPQRFAGLIGVSGYVHELERLVGELSPVAREQRLLITHGLQDPLIPIQPVRAQIAVLKSAGVRIEWHEFVKAHTMIEEELVLIRDFVRPRYSSTD